MKHILAAIAVMTSMLLTTAEAGEVLYENPLSSLEKLEIYTKNNNWKPEVVTANGKKCIQVKPGGSFGITVDLPEGKTLLVAVRCKQQDVKRNNPKKHWTGASFKGRVEIEGEKTVWCGYAVDGTSDWAWRNFKVPRSGKKGKVVIRCYLEEASGTAWYRDLSVRVVD